MKKVVVVYYSMYGAAGWYAQWIAQAVDGELIDARRQPLTEKQLISYELVVFGGGLYAGQLSGLRGMARRDPSRLILFTVGLSDPLHSPPKGFLDKYFDENAQKQLRLFHLRGALNPRTLSLPHRLALAAFRGMILRKPKNQRSQLEQRLLTGFGNPLNFIDQSSIAPIVAEIRRRLEAPQEGMR